MVCKKTPYKSFPGYGLMTETAHQRRLNAFQTMTKHARYLSECKLKLNDVQHNIESFVGAVEHPLAVVGPLLFQTDNNSVEWMHSGFCTSEGTLVASINRGAKAISECGGFRAHFIHQRMLRAPVFSFHNMEQAIRFKQWVRKNYDSIKQKAESCSNHCQLREIKIVLTGKMVHLRFIYSTSDAAGQNMVTHCTWDTCVWMKEIFEDNEKLKIEQFYIDGGGSCDKKVSYYSLQNGRGAYVIGECFLTKEVVEKTLRTNIDDMFQLYKNSMAIAKMDGVFGATINIANVIAGIFAATGQDLASIHESAYGIGEMDKVDDGLYFSLSIPNLVIGTVGGGTQLPGPKRVLDFMNCGGEGKLEYFSKLILGFCLSLDISTCAALSSGQFANAHEKHGKNKPHTKPNKH